MICGSSKLHLTHMQHRRIVGSNLLSTTSHHCLSAGLRALL